MINSYPKLLSIDKEFSSIIFDDSSSIIAQEKIDGSQISFSLSKDGELSVRSKNIDMRQGIDKMFNLAIEQIEKRKHLLRPGFIYRGEYLKSPRHNIINYGNVPKDNIIIFDVQNAKGEYLHYRLAIDHAEKINFWFVRTFNLGAISLEQAKEFDMKSSSLGDVVPEGIVFKREFNDVFNPADGKPLIIKKLREEIKEINFNRNKGNKRDDILEKIEEMYKTKPRWEKAISHLRDDGELDYKMTDIPRLLSEIKNDVFEECEEEIKSILLDFFRFKIERSLTKGFPEFYKEYLKNNPGNGGKYE